MSIFQHMTVMKMEWQELYAHDLTHLQTEGCRYTSNNLHLQWQPSIYMYKHRPVTTLYLLFYGADVQSTFTYAYASILL